MAIGRPRKEEYEEENEEWKWIKPKTEMKNSIMKEPILIESEMKEPKMKKEVM